MRGTKIVHSPDGSDRLLLFYGYSVFSNFFPSAFTVNNTRFDSVEHFYQWTKADFFASQEFKSAILMASTASLAKTLGNAIPEYDDVIWEKECYRVMKEGVKAKFQQNNYLKIELLATQGYTLAEASPFDKRWGIGRHMEDPGATDVSKWVGKNWLGEILMQLRDEFAEQHETI